MANFNVDISSQKGPAFVQKSKEINLVQSLQKINPEAIDSVTYELEMVEERGEKFPKIYSEGEEGFQVKIKWDIQIKKGKGENLHFEETYHAKLDGHEGHEEEKGYALLKTMIHIAAIRAFILPPDPEQAAINDQIKELATQQFQILKYPELLEKEPTQLQIKANNNIDSLDISPVHVQRVVEKLFSGPNIIPADTDITKIAEVVNVLAVKGLEPVVPKASQEISSPENEEELDKEGLDKLARYYIKNFETLTPEDIVKGYKVVITYANLDYIREYSEKIVANANKFSNGQKETILEDAKDIVNNFLEDENGKLYSGSYLDEHGKSYEPYKDLKSFLTYYSTTFYDALKPLSVTVQKESSPIAESALKILQQTPKKEAAETPKASSSLARRATAIKEKGIEEKIPTLNNLKETYFNVANIDNLFPQLKKEIRGQKLLNDDEMRLIGVKLGKEAKGLSGDVLDEFVAGLLKFASPQNEPETRFARAKSVQDAGPRELMGNGNTHYMEILNGVRSQLPIASPINTRLKEKIEIAKKTERTVYSDLQINIKKWFIDHFKRQVATPETMKDATKLFQLIDAVDLQLDVVASVVSAPHPKGRKQAMQLLEELTLLKAAKFIDSLDKERRINFIGGIIKLYGEFSTQDKMKEIKEIIKGLSPETKSLFLDKLLGNKTADNEFRNSLDLVFQEKNLSNELLEIVHLLCKNLDERLALHEKLSTAPGMNTLLRSLLKEYSKSLQGLATKGTLGLKYLLGLSAAASKIRRDYRERGKPENIKRYYQRFANADERQKFIENFSCTRFIKSNELSSLSSLEVKSDVISYLNVLKEKEIFHYFTKEEKKTLSNEIYLIAIKFASNPTEANIKSLDDVLSFAADQKIFDANSLQKAADTIFSKISSYCLQEYVVTENSKEHHRFDALHSLIPIFEKYELMSESLRDPLVKVLSENPQSEYYPYSKNLQLLSDLLKNQPIEKLRVVFNVLIKKAETDLNVIQYLRDLKDVLPLWSNILRTPIDQRTQRTLTEDVKVKNYAELLDSYKRQIESRIQTMLSKPGTIWTKPEDIDMVNLSQLLLYQTSQYLKESREFKGDDNSLISKDVRNVMKSIAEEIKQINIHQEIAGRLNDDHPLKGFQEELNDHLLVLQIPMMKDKSKILNTLEKFENFALKKLEDKLSTEQFKKLKSTDKHKELLKILNEDLLNEFIQELKNEKKLQIEYKIKEAKDELDKDPTNQIKIDEYEKYKNLDLDQEAEKEVEKDGTIDLLKKLDLRDKIDRKSPKEVLAILIRIQRALAIQERSVNDIKAIMPQHFEKAQKSFISLIKEKYRPQIIKFVSLKLQGVDFTKLNELNNPAKDKYIILSNLHLKFFDQVVNEILDSLLVDLTNRRYADSRKDAVPLPRQTPSGTTEAWVTNEMSKIDDLQKAWISHEVQASKFDEYKEVLETYPQFVFKNDDFSKFEQYKFPIDEKGKPTDSRGHSSQIDRALEKFFHIAKKEGGIKDFEQMTRIAKEAFEEWSKENPEINPLYKKGILKGFNDYLVKYEHQNFKERPVGLTQKNDKVEINKDWDCRMFEKAIEDVWQQEQLGMAQFVLKKVRQEALLMTVVLNIDKIKNSEHLSPDHISIGMMRMTNLARKPFF